jgi:hypothetical protein
LPPSDEVVKGLMPGIYQGNHRVADLPGSSPDPDLKLSAAVSPIKRAYSLKLDD